MFSSLNTSFARAIGAARCSDGSFSLRGDGRYRPDATAWAILALRATGAASADLQAPRQRLLQDQLQDGRLGFSPSHPQAYWPTALAILAWDQAPEFAEAQSRAVQFLLHTAGHHFPREPGAPYSHDPSIKGWAWIDHTHSWVISTSMAVLALKTAGYARHERVLEAVRLLLDRQLHQGGWNYGNTTVYGRELLPLVESTGVALNALAGLVARDSIAPSLSYLHQSAASVRPPLSLSWSLLGLGAWGEKPAAAPLWLADCRRRQDRYGSYDTVAFALMTLALALPGGLGSSGAASPGLEGDKNQPDTDEHSNGDSFLNPLSTRLRGERVRVNGV